MTHSDAEKIDRMGGSTKVAKLLGLTGPGGVQRVSNWRTRGIPASVKIEHKQYFLTETQHADSISEPN
jgi:hypothetical protein